MGYNKYGIYKGPNISAYMYTLIYWYAQYSQIFINILICTVSWKVAKWFEAYLVSGEAKGRRILSPWPRDRSLQYWYLKILYSKNIANIAVLISKNIANVAVLISKNIANIAIFILHLFVQTWFASCVWNLIVVHRQ